MHRNKDYAMGTIGNLYFIHPAHPSDFPAAGDILTTNETGAFLWKQMEHEISLDELTKLLADYYEIETDLAKEDIQNFIGQLQKINAVENKGENINASHLS